MEAVIVYSQLSGMFHERGYGKLPEHFERLAAHPLVPCRLYYRTVAPYERVFVFRGWSSLTGEANILLRYLFRSGRPTERLNQLMEWLQSNYAEWGLEKYPTIFFGHSLGGSMAVEFGVAWHAWLKQEHAETLPRFRVIAIEEIGCKAHMHAAKKKATYKEKFLDKHSIAHGTWLESLDHAEDYITVYQGISNLCSDGAAVLSNGSLVRPHRPVIPARALLPGKGLSGHIHHHILPGIQKQLTEFPVWSQDDADAIEHAGRRYYLTHLYMIILCFVLFVLLAILVFLFIRSIRRRRQRRSYI